MRTVAWFYLQYNPLLCLRRWTCPRMCTNAMIHIELHEDICAENDRILQVLALHLPKMII